MRIRKGLQVFSVTEPVSAGIQQHATGFHFAEEEEIREMLFQEGYRVEKMDSIPVSVPVYPDTETLWQGDHYIFNLSGDGVIHQTDYMMIIVFTRITDPTQTKISTEIHYTFFPTKRIDPKKYDREHVCNVMKKSAVMGTAEKLMCGNSYPYHEGWSYKHSADIVYVPVAESDVNNVQKVCGERVIMLNSNKLEEIGEVTNNDSTPENSDFQVV